MKKIVGLFILCILIAPTLQAELPVWVEGAAVMQFDDPFTLAIQGNILLDVMKNFQLRTTLLNVDLLNGVTVHLGTNMGLDALLHFPGTGKYSFYGVGGFGFYTAEKYTSFAIDCGVGAMMSSPQKSMKFFLEALISFYTNSINGNSNSDFKVGLRAGVRTR